MCHFRQGDIGEVVVSFTVFPIYFSLICDFSFYRPNLSVLFAKPAAKTGAPY